ECSCYVPIGVVLGSGTGAFQAGNRRSSSSISSAICRHCFIRPRYIERVVPSVTSNAVRSHSAALFRNITVRSPIILKQTSQGLRSLWLPQLAAMLGGGNARPRLQNRQDQRRR